MIKITNGEIIKSVTNGAFKAIYESQGYYPVDAEEVEEQEAVGTDEEVQEEVTEEEEDSTEDEVIDESEADTKWAEEQKLAPISNWKKEDLKRFVDIYGIEVGEAKKVEDVRKVVKEFLEADE